MIIETKDHYHLFLISQHVPDIKGADYTPLDFIKLMVDKLSEGFLKIFIDIEESQKINGFVVASIVEPLPQREEVFINLAWVDAKHNGVGLDLQKKAEEWARSLGINKVSTVITRGEAAYKKRYGFKREGIVLYKELKPIEKARLPAGREGKDERTIQTIKGKS